MTNKNNPIFSGMDLPEGEDCDTITKPGAYSVGNPVVQKAPVNSYGVLLVFNAGSYIAKIYIPRAGIMHYKFMGYSWSQV